MTDRLSLYNGAMAALGERKLASLTENREPRYKLDDIWDRDFVDTVLEEGQWRFAMRAAELSFSPSVSPASFGYTNGFEIPSDLIRIAGICDDEYFANPLLNYNEEAGFWWAESETIYIRYVSNDSTYGLDYSKWPKNFTRYAEHRLAQLVGPTIQGERYDSKKIEAEMKDWRRKAKSTDAMKDPARFPPRSSWSRSRETRQGDRGKRNQLIG